jgi:hypothetical protein
LKPKKGAQSETGIESHDIGSYWSLSLDDDESIDSIPFIVSRGLIMRESLQIPANVPFWFGTSNMLFTIESRVLDNATGHFNEAQSRLIGQAQATYYEFSTRMLLRISATTAHQRRSYDLKIHAKCSLRRSI